MMCQPHHFLSKFLIFRTFPAYNSYKLQSYKKKECIKQNDERLHNMQHYLKKSVQFEILNDRNDRFLILLFSLTM